MRLGIGSYAYPWAIGMPGRPRGPMTPFDLLDAAASLGVRLVQICDNMPLEELSEGDLATLHRKATETGVSIEVGTSGLQPDRVRQYLMLAMRFDSPIVRMVVDQGPFKPTPGEIVRTLREILPELERDGVRLAIENHDRFTSGTLAEIFDELDSPMVGLCLDTVNSFGSLEGPQAVVDRLAKYTVSLHVKDFRIFRSSHRLGFTLEGTPAGQGQLNVPWLLDSLRSAGRIEASKPQCKAAWRPDVNAILELWISPEDSLEATIAKERRWVAQSIAYLRGLIPD